MQSIEFSHGCDTRKVSLARWFQVARTRSIAAHCKAASAIGALLLLGSTTSGADLTFLAQISGNTVDFIQASQGDHTGDYFVTSNAIPPGLTGSILKVTPGGVVTPFASFGIYVGAITQDPATSDLIVLSGGWLYRVDEMGQVELFLDQAMGLPLGGEQLTVDTVNNATDDIIMLGTD